MWPRSLCVCLDCGFSELVIPDTELGLLPDGVQEHNLRPDYSETVRRQQPGHSGREMPQAVRPSWNCSLSLTASEATEPPSKYSMPR